MTTKTNRRNNKKPDPKARKTYDDALVQLIGALEAAESWTFQSLEAGPQGHIGPDMEPWPVVRRNLQGVLWAVEHCRDLIEGALSVEATQALQREREYDVMTDEEFASLSETRKADKAWSAQAGV
jgi:hypothetical protein